MIALPMHIISFQARPESERDAERDGDEQGGEGGLKRRRHARPGSRRRAGSSKMNDLPRSPGARAVEEVHVLLQSGWSSASALIGALDVLPGRPSGQSGGRPGCPIA